MRDRTITGPCGAIVLTLAACVLAALAPRAYAQANATAPNEADAVRAAAKEYLAALHRGDAARVRALWTADGDYVDSNGQVFKGQELAGRLEPGSAATDVPELPESTLRFLAPNIAIEDGTTAALTGDDGSIAIGRFTAIWVKRDGRWLLDGLREDATVAAPGHPKLQPLAWLVGEWTGVLDDAVVLMSWHWNDGDNYLVGEFAIYRDGQAVASGSQRIGWDPIAGQIKSWIFDSQGGAGEGRWRADGQHWIVDSTHVTADGKRAKSSATYIPGEKDTFVWEASGDWQAGGATAASSTAAAAKLPAHRIEFRRAAADE